MSLDNSNVEIHLQAVNPCPDGMWEVEPMAASRLGGLEWPGAEPALAGGQCWVGGLTL